MSSNTSRDSYIEISVNQPSLGELLGSHLLIDRSFKLGSFLVSLAAAYLFYEYIEYLVVLDACTYERTIRKRNGFIRRVAHKLDLITKDREDMYFCYLPMSHGLSVPPVYTVFQAIKEVLNTNRPASRRLCISILMELARFNCGLESGLLPASDEEDKRRRRLRQQRRRRMMTMMSRKMGSGSCEIDEADRLSDLNMSIMHFTREMLAFGVKDLETMVILHHLIEAIALQC